jgi:hypothetical protein
MGKFITIVVAMSATPALVPPGAVEYRAATHTQSIATTDGVPRVNAVHITWTDKDWHQSGGMLGLKGFVSRKFKLVPAPGVSHTLARMPVKNSFGNYQHEWGIDRAYPDGTRFDDVLYNAATGVIFEHRVREKLAGKWGSRVVHKDPDARPVGYTGLKKACSECHSACGTGDYGVALVPGGDTVFSDPLDWSVVPPKYKRFWSPGVEIR